MCGVSNFTTTIFRQLRWVALVPQGDVASQTPSLDSSVQARSGPGPGPSKRWHVSGVLKRPLSHKVLFPKYKIQGNFGDAPINSQILSTGIDFLFTTFYCIHFLFFQASYDFGWVAMPCDGQERKYPHRRTNLWRFKWLCQFEVPACRKSQGEGSYR